MSSKMVAGIAALVCGLWSMVCEGKELQPPKKPTATTSKSTTKSALKMRTKRKMRRVARYSGLRVVTLREVLSDCAKTPDGFWNPRLHRCERVPNQSIPSNFETPVSALDHRHPNASSKQEVPETADIRELMTYCGTLARTYWNPRRNRCEYIYVPEKTDRVAMIVSMTILSVALVGFAVSMTVTAVVAPSVKVFRAP